MYGNEKGVGEAIRASGLARDELFVTSKLNNGFHEPDQARKTFDQTLAERGCPVGLRCRRHPHRGVITGIADQVGRTPAQVTLRWRVQRGDIIFPKSSSPSGWRRTLPSSTSSSMARRHTGPVS